MTAAVAEPAVDPATAAERDAAAVDVADLTDRPLAAPAAADRDGRFQAVFRQSALDAIHLHGQTRTDVELCGVLVGTVCRDGHGPYLLVEHAIPAAAASSRSTNVTFTADAWHGIQTVMDRDFPDKRMIGWYHTHPGFGIFLSGMDLFICDNFFNLPWQVAFVYDPLGGDEGNFVWRGGHPTREPLLIEDDVTPAAAAVGLIPVAEAMTGSDPATTNAAAAATVFADAAEVTADYAGAGAAAAAAAAAELGPTAVPTPADWAPMADATRPPVMDEAVARLQSQTIELMERVRRLERRQRPLQAGVVFLLAFAIAWAITQWPISSPNPPAPTSANPTSPVAVPSPDPSATVTPPRAAPGPARLTLPTRGH